MRRRGRFVIEFVVLFCLPLSSHAQQWSGILNALTANQKNVSQSAIDWSDSGVPGGVPSGNWTQCGSTIQSATYGNGSIDATAAINAAIAGCPTNTYVLLGPGKFLFNSSGAGSPQITLSKNRVVLRGSGADQTILNSTGTNQDGYITIGQGYDPGRGYGTNNPVTNSVNIASGATAGSTSIVVSDGTNFAVGGAAVIQELNDASYVTKTGPSDQCDYCDGFWNGDRFQRADCGGYVLLPQLRKPWHYNDHDIPAALHGLYLDTTGASLYPHQVYRHRGFTDLLQ